VVHLAVWSHLESFGILVLAKKLSKGVHKFLLLKLKVQLKLKQFRFKWPWKHSKETGEYYYNIDA
jgi:hypothetical protein